MDPKSGPLEQTNNNFLVSDLTSTPILPYRLADPSCTRPWPFRGPSVARQRLVAGCSYCSFPWNIVKVGFCSQACILFVSDLN